MAFYNHTILAVKFGRNELEKKGIPTKRPLDYFCENIKTDAHMSKVT
jgi:rRNA-processing protein EBP2